EEEETHRGRSRSHPGARSADQGGKSGCESQGGGGKEACLARGGQGEGAGQARGLSGDQERESRRLTRKAIAEGTEARAPEACRTSGGGNPGGGDECCTLRQQWRTSFRTEAGEGFGGGGIVHRPFWRLGRDHVLSAGNPRARCRARQAASQQAVQGEARIRTASGRVQRL